jgi:hypothetical protein
MNIHSFRAITALLSAGLMSGFFVGPLRADVVAGTSFEAGQGYPAGIDVRTPAYATLIEPGNWGGNTFAGTKGGNLYTPALAEGTGTAYTGDQFFMMQRSGVDSDGDIIVRRKFPTQSGLLYYRFAFRIDSGAAQAPHWTVSNSVNFTIDRKIDTSDNSSDSNVGTEALRLEIRRDGTIVVKQNGGDATLTKRWNGTTSDGSEPVASALNHWVKVEAMADILAQKWWLSWDGTCLGSYRFKSSLTGGSGRQINMLRFQCPRLNYANGERLRIDDIELRTDPPTTFGPCLTLVSPGDVSATALAGQPATPAAVNYQVHNYGSDAASWTAVELDGTQAEADVPWLSLSANAGTLNSMETAAVMVNIDTTGVPGGDHIAYVKFSDNCNPANTTIRQVKLTVTGCTWTLDSCNQVRAVLQKYPTVPIPPVSYTMANTGQTALNYTVTPTTGSDWLVLASTGGNIGPGGSATITATVDPAWFAAQGTPGGSYTCTLTFNDDCSGLVATRQVRVRYLAEAETAVCVYNGNLDPLVDDSAGPGLRLAQYNETGLSSYGSVESDPQAGDGLAFRIPDAAQQKTKYRFVDSTGNRIPIYGEVGATIVGRLRVYSWCCADGDREGGLFIWDKDSVSATCHWGGWPEGVIKEITRGWIAPMVQPQPLTSDYVTLRVTALGRPNDTGTTNWDCTRAVHIYLDENPVPVLPASLAGVVAAQTAANYGLGFGAGSTAGSYDIAFDWVTATNAGAFAPGEEVAVIGRSLVIAGCPIDWADLDHDGDVDPVDFGFWQRCFTGSGDPDQAFDRLACSCQDRDRDGDVDITDAAVFVACTTGSGMPFDVNSPPAGCQ